jgi:hypothetical protein
MVGSAKTAMRHTKYPKLPGMVPLKWVIYNKLKIMFGGSINFEHYLNYENVHKDSQIRPRRSFLNEEVEKTLQSKSEPHYQRFGEFHNKD